MKSLYTYICEAKDTNIILDCAEKMQKWYDDNFKGYYDNEHGANKDNMKKCDLLDNKLVKADCAGFLGAVLCLAGFTENPLAYSVKFGSFNLDKHINNKRENEDIPDYIDMEYMKDLNGNWHAYKLDTYTEWPDCIPGDILYSGGHVAIVGKNNKLHQCTQYGSHDDRTFKAYWRLEK